MAPPRPCPTCGRLHCSAHHVPAWRTRKAPPPRTRGRELQRRRARLFSTNPWCVTCAKEGRRTLATIRDHVIPLAEGGCDDETNEQGLCQRCSDRKTQDEAKRGVQRR
jgi:5-methylcytosine-specific restriction enzyme A